jgi:hypothetical protein
MTAQPPLPSDPIDLATFARGLAIVLGGAVMMVSAFAWGAPGLRAAGVGAALSVLNVFVLTRFARQAIVVAAEGWPNTAIVRLTGALNAKTVFLLCAVWIVMRSLHPHGLALALGLLVTVFSLLVAGLARTLRTE